MTIKRCYPVLVGASVVENQLFYERATQTKNGITLTNNGDGSYTLNGTSTDRVQYTGSVGAMSVGTNHKILMLANGVSGTCDKKFAMFFFFQHDGGRDYPALNVFVNGALNKTALIYNTYKSGTISASGIILDIEATGTVCTNLKITPQVIDLTQMLGSSIADRAYTLEQQTAGSGLAWLRSYGFLGGYVPYNSGTIESVEATAKVVRDENGENAVTYPLGSDVLRGIFKLANGKLYADGDRKEADGTIERKYKILTITSNMITFPSNTYSNIQYAKIAKPTDSIDRMKASSNCMHTSFPVNTATSNWDYPNKVGYLFGGASHEDYWFGFPSGTTLGQAQMTLAGTQLVYELATPTTEQSTPFTSPQICYPDGTEEFITENGVPVGHETKYQL